MKQEYPHGTVIFARFIWFVLYVIEGILLLRFLLKIMGANPFAGFTAFIYNLSAPFVSPFLYVVPSPAVSASVFEWPVVIALIVYWFIAWILIRLALIGKPARKREEIRPEHIEVHHHEHREE